jgi:F-type H+-transporting ATPase subunit alpha
MGRKIEIKERGIIISIKGPVIKIKGLPTAKMGEVLWVGRDQKAVIFKISREFTKALIEENFVLALALGDAQAIRIGEEVQKTGSFLKVPVGQEFLGRIIDPLGKDLESGREIRVEEERGIENLPLQITERDLIRESLETGIKIIDALFPIGRGQRELILGDQKTGKTTLALDVMLNQKDDVVSIYCSIGQKKSEIVEFLRILREFGKQNYVAVAAFASDSSVLQFLAPFSAMSLAEYFRDKGKDVLIVFDDLTKHAWVWREISLLLNSPPGREAYPGDIFYLHARLLERAGRAKRKGSITALPICETKEGDITEYVPTNLISITDGQLYLEKDLFQQGQIPAINIGLSVSRVGSFAQKEYLKEATKGLRLLLSQHKELKKLAQLETKISEKAKKNFQRGEILLEFFKQKKHRLIDSAVQSFIYFAILNGFFDKLKVEEVEEIEGRILRFLENFYPNFKKEISENKWSEQIKRKIFQAIERFRFYQSEKLGIKKEAGKKF